MKYFEVANPKRILIESKEQYLNFIKRNNGVANLYRTVYNFKYLKTKYTPDYNSAIINQMFFDCDSERSYEVVKEFTKGLDEDNYKYYLKQSSYMKFHIYVLCSITNLENKKSALINSMIYLSKKYNLTYGDSKTSDLDKSTFGDLARICPIPGTYKPLRKSYCSYITKEDLLDINKLKEKAKLGNGKLVIYGNKLFDLKPFDYINHEMTICNNAIIDKDDFDVKFDNKYIDSLPPFIKKVLTNYNNYCDNYINRWRVGLYLRDIGYPESLTEQILKEYYSKHLNFSTMNGRGTQWDRYVKCKALWFTYHSEFKEFPNTQTLLNEGYEITKEDGVAINKLYMK